MSVIILVAVLSRLPLLSYFRTLSIASVSYSFQPIIFVFSPLIFSFFTSPFILLGQQL